MSTTLIDGLVNIINNHLTFELGHTRTQNFHLTLSDTALWLWCMVTVPEQVKFNVYHHVKFDTNLVKCKLRKFQSCHAYTTVNQPAGWPNTDYYIYSHYFMELKIWCGTPKLHRGVNQPQWKIYQQCSFKDCSNSQFERKPTHKYWVQAI